MAARRPAGKTHDRSGREVEQDLANRSTRGDVDLSIRVTCRRRIGRRAGAVERDLVSVRRRVGEDTGGLCDVHVSDYGMMPMRATGSGAA